MLYRPYILEIKIALKLLIGLFLPMAPSDLFLKHSDDTYRWRIDKWRDLVCMQNLCLIKAKRKRRLLFLVKFLFYNLHVNGNKGTVDRCKQVVQMSHLLSENIRWQCSCPERFYGKLSQHSLNICVDHFLINAKESLQNIWPLATLFSAYQPQFMQAILNFIFSRLFHVLCRQCWTCKLQSHIDTLGIKKTCPERWNCRIFVGTFSAGECLPSFHTLVAEAATLLGRTLDCLTCNDGCNSGIFLIL